MTSDPGPVITPPVEIISSNIPISPVGITSTDKDAPIVKLTPKLFKSMNAQPEWTKLLKQKSNLIIHQRYSMHTTFRTLKWECLTTRSAFAPASIHGYYHVYRHGTIFVLIIWYINLRLWLIMKSSLSWQFDSSRWEPDWSGNPICLDQ